MSRNKRGDKGEGGFTLLEVLVTVALLAILAAVIVPVFTGHAREARIKADTVNTRLLQGAYDLYFRDHGEFPVHPGHPDDDGIYAHDREHELVTGGYLDEIPASPFGIDPGYRHEGKLVRSCAEGVYYNK